MKQKHIDASRELRLWITQVFIPTGALIVGSMTIPEVRQYVGAKAENVKQKLKKKQ